MAASAAPPPTMPKQLQKAPYGLNMSPADWIRARTTPSVNHAANRFMSSPSSGPASASQDDPNGVFRDGSGATPAAVPATALGTVSKAAASAAEPQWKAPPLEWVTSKLREQEKLNTELVAEITRQNWTQNQSQDESIQLRQALIRYEEEKAAQALYLERFQAEAHVRVHEMEQHYEMAHAHQRRMNEEQMLHFRAEMTQQTAWAREIQQAQQQPTPYPQPRPPQPQVPDTPCTPGWVFAGVSIATPPSDEEEMSET